MGRGENFRVSGFVVTVEGFVGSSMAAEARHRSREEENKGDGQRRMGKRDVRALSTCHVTEAAYYFQKSVDWIKVFSFFFC